MDPDNFFNRTGAIFCKDESYNSLIEVVNEVIAEAKVKDENGNLLRYEDKPVIFKHKSRVYAKTIQIERDDKRKNKVIIYQKQMVYFQRVF